MDAQSVRELFGGAIKVNLPDRLIDASDLRQVPDTQEVFLYPSSNVSIIVEVLQRVQPADSKDAAKFHFESLAHENDAKAHVVNDIVVIPNDRGDATPSPVVLSGIQEIAKYNRSTIDKVHIFLALYRVENKNVDLVMSMNYPVQAADEGAAGQNEPTAKQDFDTAVRSLRIVDFALFA